MRGGYRARLGDLEGASADYDRLIALQDRPYARFLRANLTAKRGEPARALADYDRAIEAQPGTSSSIAVAHSPAPPWAAARTRWRTPNASSRGLSPRLFDLELSENSR